MYISKLHNIHGPLRIKYKTPIIRIKAEHYISRVNPRPNKDLNFRIYILVLSQKQIVTDTSRRTTGVIRVRTSSSLPKKFYPCDPLMGVRQNPWTPTKRRGPIAAEASSPGPAVVSLPTLIGTVHK